MLGNNWIKSNNILNHLESINRLIDQSTDWSIDWLINLLVDLSPQLQSSTLVLTVLTVLTSGLMWVITATQRHIVALIKHLRSPHIHHMQTNIIDDKYEAQTGYLLMMIYSSGVSAGVICVMDCRWSNLIVYLRSLGAFLDLRARSLFFFSAGMPSCCFFSHTLSFHCSPRGRTHGCFYFYFFSGFAFVYLRLCSGLSHYLAKWRRSLPVGP